MLGQGQELLKRFLAQGFVQNGKLIETCPLGNPGAFDQSQRLQGIQGPEHRLGCIAQQVSKVICTDQTDLVMIEEDQHIPLAERFNACGLEPTPDLGVLRSIRLHDPASLVGGPAGREASTGTRPVWV
jgi:hypothetical protein